MLNNVTRSMNQLRNGFNYHERYTFNRGALKTEQLYHLQF